MKKKRLDTASVGLSKLDRLRAKPMKKINHGQKCEAVTLLFIYSKALFE